MRSFAFACLLIPFVGLFVLLVCFFVAWSFVDVRTVRQCAVVCCVSFLPHADSSTRRGAVWRGLRRLCARPLLPLTQGITYPPICSNRAHRVATHCHNVPTRYGIAAAIGSKRERDGSNAVEFERRRGCLSEPRFKWHAPTRLTTILAAAVQILSYCFSFVLFDSHGIPHSR